ncbi:MAG: RNase H-like domain-containing protein, partial [bacterium]
FDGTLGDWKTEPVSIELKEGIKPFKRKPYQVAKINEAAFKKELDRLCDLKVLERCGPSQWASPSTVIPKKDNRVRFISDFRGLNARIKRKAYPLPKISDLMQKLEGFTYATALDLNMGYFTIRLDKEAQDLCTIVTPWGNYRYLRLPLGLANSPDIFQDRMSTLMIGLLEFVRTYLDDILLMSKGSFEDHLEKLKEVLIRLSNANLKINVSKSKFCQTEVEYLGFWITREGIQPLPRKVDAMIKIARPRNRKQLRSFIGLVNFYRDMWRHRSGILAPLSKATSNSLRWKWTPEMQDAFDQIKAIISKKVLLSYPDFSKPFKVYTDASNEQLGAVIIQEKTPLAFYSRKLNSAQKRYTTTERELLSIVETLREFNNILLGHVIVVYTDHKNLTHENVDSRSNRVQRWLQLIDEYGVQLQYIQGEKNIVADALSRLPSEDYFHVEPISTEMSKLFALEEALNPAIFPMHMGLIAEQQAKDDVLQDLRRRNPQDYHLQNVERHNVVWYQNKIYIPETLRQRTLHWYHDMLHHPGKRRTEKTIRSHLTWHGLTNDVLRHVKECSKCQLFKKQRKKYGHLPSKEAEWEPWRTLCVDLIGPYDVKTLHNKNKQIWAMTMIDPATSWFEVIEIPNKRMQTCAALLDREWLCRYPRPTELIYDNGKEFKNEEFHELTDSYGIHRNGTSVKNPQANGILERVHQVLANMLRTFNLENQVLDDNNTVQSFLSSAAWAIRSTYHTTLDATPGQLVFGRDMIFNLAHVANWERIRQRKQNLIDRSNTRENAKRIPHNYAIGDKVTIENMQTQRKIACPRQGPYVITRINANGTVVVQRSPAVTETLNIRRLNPFHSPVI